MKKRLIIWIFVLFQLIGAIYATIQGEKLKQAELNHIKIVENYYNLLKTN